MTLRKEIPWAVSLRELRLKICLRAGFVQDALHPNPSSRRCRPKIGLKICKVEICAYICNPKTKNGALAERLGTGLQNLLQRFDSARHLQKSLWDISEAFFIFRLSQICPHCYHIFKVFSNSAFPKQDLGGAHWYLVIYDGLNINIFTVGCYWDFRCYLLPSLWNYIWSCFPEFFHINICQIAGLQYRYQLTYSKYWSTLFDYCI